MNRSRPRRLGALTAALALASTLLVPGVAAADDLGAATIAPETSSASHATRSAQPDRPVEVRSLDFACPRGRVPAGGFVDSEGVYGRAIDCLVWYRITEGRTATTFEPNGFVNRRQMALFLYRILEYLDAPLPEYDGTNSFPDVLEDDVAREAINMLASPAVEELLGRTVVAGRPDGTYDPGGRVTREQMGSFVARMLEGIAHASGSEIIPGDCIPACFRDSHEIAPAHRDNVDLLFQIGIVTGRSDDTYAPRDPVNRGQMALFVTRLMDVFVEQFPFLTPDAGNGDD